MDGSSPDWIWLGGMDWSSKDWIWLGGTDWSSKDWFGFGGPSMNWSLIGGSSNGWYKKDATAQEYAQVKFDCLQASQYGQSLANVDVTVDGGGVPSKVPPNPDLVNACMNAHGFYMMKTEQTGPRRNP